ncbi:MAG: PEP-CTERM sorting domain-containing protein [Pirellulales bacterium]
MIRRALLVVLVLAGVGRECVAVTPLALWIDPDGTTYLYNTTDAPISFDGYQIASETNRLDPVGWKSIADYVAAGQISEVIAALGAGGLTFGEANPGAGNIAELNLGGVGTLQPHAKFSIGKPFLDTAVCTDGTADFFYKVGGSPNGGVAGDSFVNCPEPGSWLLVTLGGFGVLILRRSAAKSP